MNKIWINDAGKYLEGKRGIPHRYLLSLVRYATIKEEYNSFTTGFIQAILNDDNSLQGK